MATITETITETMTTTSPGGSNETSSNHRGRRSTGVGTSLDVKRFKQFVQKQRICFDPIEDAEEYLYTGSHKFPRCSDSNLRSIHAKVKKDSIFLGDAVACDEESIDGFELVAYETEAELHKAMLKSTANYIEKILQERDNEKKGVKRVVSEEYSNSNSTRVKRVRKVDHQQQQQTPRIKVEPDSDSNDSPNMVLSTSLPEFPVSTPPPSRVITSRKRGFRRFSSKAAAAAAAASAIVDSDSATKIAAMLQRTSRSGRTIKPSKAVLNADYLDDEYIDALEKGQFDFYKVNGPRRPRGFRQLTSSNIHNNSNNSSTSATPTVKATPTIKEEPNSGPSVSESNLPVISVPSTSNSSKPQVIPTVPVVSTKIRRKFGPRKLGPPKPQVSLLRKTKTGAYTYKARSSAPLVRVHNHLLQSSPNFRPFEDGTPNYPTSGAVEVMLFSKPTNDGMKTFLKIPGRMPYEINRPPYRTPKRVLINADALNSLPPPAVTPAMVQYKRPLTDGHGITDTDRTYIVEVLKKLEENPEVRFFKRFDSLVPGLVAMQNFPDEETKRTEGDKFVRMLYKCHERHRNRLTELLEEREKLKEKFIKPAAENGLKSILEREQAKAVRENHIIHTVPMVSKPNAAGLNVFRPINAGSLPSNAQFMVVKTAGPGQTTEAKGVNGNVFRLLAGQAQPHRTIKLMVSQSGKTTASSSPTTVTTSPMVSTSVSNSIIKGTGQIKISPGSQVIKMGPVRTTETSANLPDGVKLVQLSPVVGTKMGAPNHSGQYLRTILPNIRSQSGTIKVISTIPGSSATMVTQSRIPAAEVKLNPSVVVRKRGEESLLRSNSTSIIRKDPVLIVKKSEEETGSVQPEKKTPESIVNNGGDDSEPEVTLAPSGGEEETPSLPVVEEAKSDPAEEEVVTLEPETGVEVTKKPEVKQEEIIVEDDDDEEEDDDIVLVSELRAPTMKRLNSFQTTTVA